MSDEKRQFFTKLGKKENLSNYKKAYIIIIVLGFFELSEGGIVDFDDLAYYFREFYRSRKEKGFIVESKPSTVIQNIDSTTIRGIKSFLLKIPFNTMIFQDLFFSVHEDKIIMKKSLWKELSRDDIETIKDTLNSQLHKYFNEKVDGLNMGIPEVDEKKIISALKEYDLNLRDQPNWRDFSQNKNHKYAIQYENRLYPVKKIISMATNIGVSSFSGGDEANGYLTKKGFQIIEIERLLEESLKDYFDRIMDTYTQAKTKEEFKGHELGKIFREHLPHLLQDYLQEEENNYVIKGSIGQGSWAKIPWISIMDKEITSTTQKGVYITYLFSADMNRLYLTLMQGVTKISVDELKKTKMKLRDTLDLSLLNTDDAIDLAAEGRADDYEESTIGYLEYEKGSIPSDKELLLDLQNVLQVYLQYKQQYRVIPSLTVPEIIKKIKEYIQQKGFTYPPGLIENFFLALKTKPFVILAGISGTGKTKLVELFANAIGCTQENGQYQLIAVRPDWSDSTDLLGFTDIRGRFKPGPIIDTIKRAIDEPNNHFFVCLDEMNLARVEYYFSDFLSAMETRQRRDGQLKSHPLLTEKDFTGDNEGMEKYASLYIPDNLSLVGTVNMDETTHPFSKKVLDRANTIEFSEIDLLPPDTETLYLAGETKILDHIPTDFLKPHYTTLKECLDKDRDFTIRVIVRLKKVNELLKKANLHIGYRIRDEICFFMLYNNQYGLLDFNRAFDYQLLQKILPRIQGNTQQIKRLLIDLVSHTSGENFTVKEGIVAEKVESYITTSLERFPYQNSSMKLSFMLRRFEDDGFTAYWL